MRFQQHLKDVQCFGFTNWLGFFRHSQLFQPLEPPTSLNPSNVVLCPFCKCECLCICMYFQALPFCRSRKYQTPAAPNCHVAIVGCQIQFNPSVSYRWIIRMMTLLSSLPKLHFASLFQAVNLVHVSSWLTALVKGPNATFRNAMGSSCVKFNYTYIINNSQLLCSVAE